MDKICLQKATSLFSYSFTSSISEFSFSIVTVTNICCKLRQVTCWVEWDDSSDELFCKTCKEAKANGLLKFSTKKDDTFISVGFSNWKKALEKCRLHEETEIHKESLLKLASSSKQSVAIQLNYQLNKDMENARSALMAIFTTLRFLCLQGLSIRGHEDEKSVLRSVVCEMKKREHFAIIVDETCDISIHEQVTICIQSVDENLTISEDFVGLYETPNTDGKTLFGIMKDILARLQKFVADLQPKAIYVHCAQHSLNLAVQDCLRHLPCMRDITNLAKDLINTVRESPTRTQLFKNIREEKIGLRPLCPTRWTMRGSSIQQVLINYERLLEFFETYSEEYSSDAVFKCAGYLETIQHFRAFFFSSLYCHVMSPVEEVNVKIQCPHIGVTEVESKLSYIYILEEKCGGYKQFWQKYLEEKPTHVEEPPCRRATAAPKTTQEYVGVSDMVILYVQDRFNCNELQKLVSVEKECVSAVIAVNNTTPKLEKTRELFCGDLDTDRLHLHLTTLGDIAKWKRVAITSIHDTQEFLKEDSTVRDLLPEVNKCIKLLRTVPVTTATAERSFSALRRLKTYLWSTMGQKRLNNTALLKHTSDCAGQLGFKTSRK
ncbi:hypothetical protein PR048_009887 [Dryococelus australis]|uniref:HAT C-terminal dimerisation domain-containing protein n=1 Tax=Dryococelus australis TaxID=614101 RepID=A0ABQ9I239_9NEOP|nr:hypothetical protein PR048_009887 [Dryococelus australis]